MYLVVGPHSTYIPKMGIMISDKDKKHWSEIIGHEMAHHALKHEPWNKGDWQKFLDEVDAWDLALSRGLEADEKFVRRALLGYISALKDEDKEEAFEVVDEMLERYF